MEADHYSESQQSDSQSVKEEFGFPLGRAGPRPLAVVEYNDLEELVLATFTDADLRRLLRARAREQREQVHDQRLSWLEEASQDRVSPRQSIAPDLPSELVQEFQLVRFNEGDPENPVNWPMPKKFFATFLICLLTLSVYIGSSIYTAGLPSIEQQFKVGEVKALLGLTLFVLGYGIGPMVWAPLSEMPYFGRSPIYKATLFGFVVLQFGVIYARNFPMLLAFRFLTGFVGSPVLATGGASIIDMYSPEKRAYGISLWGLSAVMGPTLGPIIGGFAAEAKGWKWTIWPLTWLGGFCFVLLVCFLPETSSANILYRRACHLRKVTGETKKTLKCEAELGAEGLTRRDMAMMILVRPFTLTFSEPIVFLLNSYIALIYALIYIWFESFPLVFIEVYGFTLGKVGLAFVGILVGALLAVPPYWWYLYRFTEPNFHNGDLRPELRLPPACVGAFFIPVCLFWFGWSSRQSIHWIMPIIAGCFFSIGAFLVFNAVLNYLGDAYPRYSASIFAGNTLMRAGFGAAFPLFAGAMYRKLGIQWASTLLAFLSVLFIPIPFLLYRYGKSIRRRSRRARHDI